MAFPAAYQCHMMVKNSFDNGNKTIYFVRVSYFNRKPLDGFYACGCIT